MFSNRLVSGFRSRKALFPIRLIQLPRVFLYKFCSTLKVAGNPTLNQPLQSVGLGEIRFFGKVDIGVFPSPYFFSTYAYIEARNSGSSVLVGEGTWINNNFCAIAEHTSITIGKRVLVGTNVEIYDSDFHGIHMRNRGASLKEKALPVHIGDDVFLGSNVKILKGVSIGKGSVIANSSVVTNDIPAGVVAAGIPARVQRAITE